MSKYNRLAIFITSIAFSILILKFFEGTSGIEPKWQIWLSGAGGLGLIIIFLSLEKYSLKNNINIQWYELINSFIITVSVNTLILMSLRMTISIGLQAVVFLTGGIGVGIIAYVLQINSDKSDLMTSDETLGYVLLTSKELGMTREEAEKFVYVMEGKLGSYSEQEAKEKGFDWLYDLEKLGGK